MDILSSDCHIHLILFLSSYSFNNLIHIFLKISNSIHCCNCLWHVEPEPYSFGSIFLLHPVIRTYRIPSITFLNGIAVRPMVSFGFSYGKSSSILSHNSSEIVVMVDMFLLLCRLKEGTTLS